MAAGDLCSLSDVRLALEMPAADTSRDSYCSALIAIYSQAIINEVNREFAPVTGSVGTPTTRRFRLEAGQYRMDLDPYDLQTVTSVVANPESASPVTLTETDQYILQPITKPDGVFTSVEFSRMLATMYSSTTMVRYGFAMVDVSGVWGFPSVPAQVKQACILAVTSAMRRDVSAFGMDVDEAMQLATERSSSYGLPPASRRLLNSYRRHVVF
jgi:hypothetical protein